MWWKRGGLERMNDGGREKAEARENAKAKKKKKAIDPNYIDLFN